MKHIYNLLAILLGALFIHTSCSDENEPTTGIPEITTINPVKELSAAPSAEEYAIDISWLNDSDNHLYKVEITYQAVDEEVKSSPNPMLVNAVPDSRNQLTIQVPDYNTYVIGARAIGTSGQRSDIVTITSESSAGIIEKKVPEFLLIGDTLMTSLIQKCLGGPRDVWRDYPTPTGAYWDGDALVWGQGGGLSAFAAMREASFHSTDMYKEKYAGMDNRMVASIDKFRVVDSRNNIEGYSVYPASGNDRYFDDNVWIGIDMIDLYLLTEKNTFLTRANIVWKYLLTGMEEDGGVYWQELPEKSTSKHACSSAPTAVLAAKLYLATGESGYLEQAKKIYQWCIDILQDKNDLLIWDNQRADGSVDPAKYTYNSGQAVQAAALLYKITGENRYLEEAQQIAEAIYKKWFYTINSLILGREINMISGHTWFNAVTLRGFIELYKLDGNRKYISAYEEMLQHAWNSTCRNKDLNFLNYNNFEGGIIQTSFEILHTGATVEMIARLATLAAEGL